jgi:hypothetical protein
MPEFASKERLSQAGAASLRGRAVERALRSPGQALDPATRSFMDQRFGHDFGRVRVHDGAEAERAAGAMGARSWTLGTDIFFGRGMYRPSDPRGAGLLAHELAHVIQQRNLSRFTEAPEIGEADGTFEQEADEGARMVAAGEKPQLEAATAPPGIQRSLLSGFLDVALFIPRLFGAGGFPIEQLQEYLQTIRRKKGPEDSLFSDNKARACVSRENELGPYDTNTKTWLVQEMLTGHVSFLDENSTIELLDRSQDREQIVAAVGRDWLWSKFSGQKRRKIEAMTLTAADAGDPLVARLRSLTPDEFGDYAGAKDPAVQESIRRARALANITTPVPAEAPVGKEGQADFVINGVQVTVLPDKIIPGLGNQAFTRGRFGGQVPPPFDITPDIANQPVAAPAPVTITLTIWTEFGSEEAKSGTSQYGVGTRPQDKPTLQFHERSHGEAWLRFLHENPPPVFKGAEGMLPAQYNAAVDQFTKDFDDYDKKAHLFALKAGDCAPGSKFPTDEQLRGAGYTAAICWEQ